MDNESTVLLHTGSKMPVLGLGTWQLTNDTPVAVAYALGLGYRMIDTSSDYGTHKGIAIGIKKSGLRREHIYIVTKVEEDDDSYARTLSNLEELDVDYIDLMLIHRPPRRGAGETLWEGLMRAKKNGLVRDIGVSNYSTHLIQDLIFASGEIPTVNQIEWSPFGYSEDMLKFCNERNIIIQAYSPLTRGTRLNDRTLQSISKKYNRTPAQILLRWNLQRGTVPLPKANQLEHLEENIGVFNFELEKDDIERLNRLNEGYSALGTLPYISHRQQAFGI